MQLKAISSHPFTWIMAEGTSPHLVAPSFQVVVESNEGSPSLLLSRQNNPTSLSCSAQGMFARPFTRFIALVWTPSSTPKTSFWNEGPRTGHGARGTNLSSSKHSSKGVDSYAGSVMFLLGNVRKGSTACWFCLISVTFLRLKAIFN